MKKNGLLDDEKAALTKNTSLSAFVMQSLRDRRQRQNAAPATKDHSFPVIASYNVHKCVGRDRKFDPDRTSRVIQEIGADIIALQEADSRFGERTGLLDLARLERESGLIPVPVQAGVKAHGWHGNVVLFKEGAVRDVHTLKLPGARRGTGPEKRRHAEGHRRPFRASQTFPRPAGKSTDQPSRSAQ